MSGGETEAPALAIRGACKAFAGRPILRDVSMSLRTGRVTAALGRSGAGKSTLLRLIAGLERLDDGEITAGDRILSGPGTHLPPEARRVGLVFQDYALFPHLTALQNVMFGIAKLEKSERRARAMSQLEAVHLADRADAHPHALSGGEQQRVALARALAPSPDIVLLDEPFSGLDARLREATRETALAALKESGAAVLIVTHDSQEAMLMADDLVLMAHGRIVQAGDPDTLYRQPVSADAARLLGEVNEWRGQVRGGALPTPFGPVPAHGLDDGRSAVALVRPEGVSLLGSSHSEIVVSERRSAGADAVLRVRAPGGEEWRARMPAARAPKQGDSVSVLIDPALAPVLAE